METSTTNNAMPIDDQQRIESIRKTLYLCYILFGLTFFVGGITALAAIIINYLKKGDADQFPKLAAHFTWQRNTFWVSLACGLLGVLTIFFGVGFFIILAGAVWTLYRCIKGWMWLADGKDLYPSK